MLRATLCEVERGLFYIAYSLDVAAPGRRLLPPYQVGTSASDAMRRVEQEARACGFESIVWDELTPTAH
jgi:hypothetical protein